MRTRSETAPSERAADSDLACMAVPPACSLPLDDRLNLANLMASVERAIDVRYALEATAISAELRRPGDSQPDWIAALIEKVDARPVVRVRYRRCIDGIGIGVRTTQPITIVECRRVVPVVPERPRVMPGIQLNDDSHRVVDRTAVRYAIEQPAFQVAGMLGLRVRNNAAVITLDPEPLITLPS